LPPFQARFHFDAGLCDVGFRLSFAFFHWRSPEGRDIRYRSKDGWVLFALPRSSSNDLSPIRRRFTFQHMLIVADRLSTNPLEFRAVRRGRSLFSIGAERLACVTRLAFSRVRPEGASSLYRHIPGVSFEVERLSRRVFPLCRPEGASSSRYSSSMPRMSVRRPFVSGFSPGQPEGSVFVHFRSYNASLRCIERTVPKPSGVTKITRVGFPRSARRGFGNPFWFGRAYQLVGAGFLSPFSMPPVGDSHERPSTRINSRKPVSYLLFSVFQR